MIKEIWKDIPGYKDLYQVSNLGKIKSLLFKREKILKTRVHPNGYELINLKGKTYKVHYLVAKTFISNPNNYKEINHKDENKQNNCVHNLEWCDRKYNCNYGSLPSNVAKRFSKKIAMLDDNNNAIIYFESSMAAERILGVDHSSIIKCCKGIVKTAGGYKWKYVEEVVKSEI